MDATQETKPLEVSRPLTDRNRSDALQAFAQLLAWLAADRSVSDAWELDAGAEEMAFATAGQATGVV